MKNICMIAYTYYIYDPRVKREAEALAERGDSVDVICLSEEKNKKDEKINNVNIIRLKIGKYRGNNPVFYLISYFIFFIKAFFKLSIDYFNKHYQIVHIHTMPDFLVFTSIIPKLFGAKIILDIHDLMPELYISKFKFNEKHLLIKFITFIERWSVKFAHQAISVHKTHLQALVKHGNPSEKLKIVLNLPDPKIFFKDINSINKNKEKITFLYHGTISERHGIEIAIRALYKIYQETPKILLKIIGDGDDLDRLCKLTEDLGLTKYIYFNKAYVSLEEIVQEINQSDIGIIPILMDDFTYYMLPTKLLEYVALDLPVICTRTDTVETYFNDSMVCYFNSGNIDELALCMKDLYFNMNKRFELVKHANVFNQNYNWYKQKQIFYELVDES
jgi:glycosyltransferase involved in cell wall biosynthesis